ncbi:MAG: sugar phosphate isomerase/epimerase [Ruminococcus sp.]|nr:sugar phosphate isomerase/epimerase [Ruminococcus sp.]
MLKKLRQRHWDAIEVAPSRIWEDFRRISSQERRKYKEKILGYDLKICSLHSLFWGIQEPKLFGTKLEQQAFQDYMKELVDLAVDLDSKVMILGSPLVRDRRKYEYGQAMDIAVAVIQEVAEYALKNKIKILIEPLTKKETNFINTHSEGLELVRKVNSEGFGLHLDAKAITAENTKIEKIILDCKEYIRHFHINDPNLQQIGIAADYHKKIGEMLQKIDYSGYVSIEMRMTDKYRDCIEQSMEYVELYY